MNIDKTYNGELDSIVLDIPQNAVKLEYKVTIYADDELHILQGISTLADIQKMKETFHKYESGELPLFVSAENCTL